MNTCEKCNNPVPVEKAFCPNCGAAMMPERERAVDYMSEEMLPTIYEQDPPPRNPPTPKPPSMSVKAEPGSTPSALGGTERKPSVATRKLPNVAPRETTADASNRILYSILIAAGVLFMLSIIIVAVLYMMGKI